MSVNDVFFILIALAFSAFFSGIEIAFISANKLRIALNSKQGGFVWKLLENYYAETGKFISTTLVGNNIALVLYGIVMGGVLESLLSTSVQSDVLRLILVTSISTFVVLIISEFLPKALFRLNPVGFLKVLIIPFHICYIMLWPMVMLTRYISRGFLKLISGGEVDDERPVFTKMDLDFIISETQQVELDEEKQMDTEIFKNALDFSNLKVRDCMKPRTEIVAMDESEGVEGLYQIFIQSRHSKIPIFRDQIDNIIGYVHQGAMFTRPDSVESVLIPIVITNESRPINEVLNELIKSRKSLAVVVDEFGGTAGIITIEDILEEIFGEIEDEYDIEELKETQIKEGKFIFSGRLEIDYLNEKYKLDIPEGEYETLGGYIIANYDKIPNENEIVLTDKFEIKIIAMENARVKEVELKVLV
jgi:putative hemolysin